MMIRKERGIDQGTNVKRRKLGEVKELITPSSFEKCKGHGSWVKRLKKINGQIECHRIERSDDEIPIPIVLLHKTFAQFEQNCKEIMCSKNDYQFVMKLCEGMSTPYESKAAFAEKARDLLEDYLLDDLPGFMITPMIINGSISDGSYRYGETLLMNLACQLQKGHGSGDPMMQNVAFYLKSLPNVINRQFPCLLVDICGPLLSVFGIVNTGDENAICEPLVMSFPLLFFNNEWMMVSLTRTCLALKVALKELTEECHQFHADRRNLQKNLRVMDLNHRLRFPYKDSIEINGALISLQYTQTMQRFVFVATTQDGNEVVVKCSTRYGIKVHQYCSNVGFAPALLGFEYLPNGWAFIVMEKLSLIPLWQPKEDGYTTNIRDQLDMIKRSLQTAAFVHGDLRENNILWDTDNHRVVLIDFDWSGKDGMDKYPPFMNTEITWPPGAETGKPLQVAHDAYWFDSIVSRVHL